MGFVEWGIIACIGLLLTQTIMFGFGLFSKGNSGSYRLGRSTNPSPPNLRSAKKSPGHVDIDDIKGTLAIDKVQSSNLKSDTISVKSDPDKLSKLRDLRK